MNWLLAQANATRLPLADGSVDMVFTSPPYLDARTYGIMARRGCRVWINWMLGVVDELTRVCSGLVFVNCAGVTRDRIYQPGPEGLLYEWWKRGGHCWRPAYWHRVGIPGSGGKHWLRADIEYVLAFKRDGEWPAWSDNTANGHRPKWGPGGEMSHRLSDGNRVNVKPFGNQQSSVGRRPNGERKRPYFNGKRSHRLVDANNRLERGNEKGRLCSPVPVLANPGNLLQVPVGGGVMGHPLAHENEAPFPQKLAEWFIRGWTRPGGIVLDPFSGSGTTVAAALALGRRGIGFDLRMNQCELGRRRILSPMARRMRKAKPTKHQATLFAEDAA